MFCFKNLVSFQIPDFIFKKVKVQKLKSRFIKKHLSYLFTKTQKVDRFCHSCGELYSENDRFYVKCFDKRISTLDKEGDKELKESKRPKSLDEYIKEKGKERGDFFKPKFLQNADKSS